MREPHPDITHQVLLSDDPEHKRKQLRWLLGHESASNRPWCSSTPASGRAARQLAVGNEQRCAVLHGDLDQRERKRVMALFRDGRRRRC
jgi:ATP-dependent RNA helicase SrmB